LLDSLLQEIFFTMAVILNRHSVKLNIGKLSKKISDLEVQRRKIFENIAQLKEARDRLIFKLRSLPPENHINLPDVEKITHKNTNKDESRDIFETGHDKTDSVPDLTSATDTSLNNDASNTNVKSAGGQKYLTTDACPDEFWEAFATDLPEDVWADDKFEDMELCDDIPVNVDKDIEPIVISDDEEEEINAIKDLSHEICNASESVVKESNLVQSFSNFQFKASSSSSIIPAFKKPAASFKVPAVPAIQKPVLKHRKAKSKKGKLFDMQHILGECRKNKPVNSKADFDKAEYYLLRPSGQRGVLARGRELDEVKCVTKKPLAYSETGWKRNGVSGEALFVVTGKHDHVGQAVEPVHLDGKAEFTSDGKVVFQGQLYSQLSQTQCYV